MLGVLSKNTGNWVPGALVRVRNEAAAEDVYLLVTHYSAMTSSSLRSLKLKAPAGELSIGNSREWAREVSIDEESCTSLVQLRQPAVDAMLAAGVVCRALGTAAVGMSAAYVMSDAASVFAETTERTRIVRVENETLAVATADTQCGLLVGEDGSLLAVTQKEQSTHYSLAEIVKHFLDDQMWKIRCRVFTINVRAIISFLFKYFF